jgi:Tfp pilus assembly protein FimT
MAEVLGAILVTAILTGTGLPAFLQALQTYRFGAAARQIAIDLRFAQSLAVAKKRFYRIRMEVSQPNRYRLEGSNDAATWPAPSDTPQSNPDVITTWKDLATDYREVTVTTSATVTFNSRGAVEGGGTPTIVIQDLSGATKSVETSAAGRVKIL